MRTIAGDLDYLPDPTVWSAPALKGTFADVVTRVASTSLRDKFAAASIAPSSAPPVLGGPSNAPPRRAEEPVAGAVGVTVEAPDPIWYAAAVAGAIVLGVILYKRRKLKGKA